MKMRNFFIGCLAIVGVMIAISGAAIGAGLDEIPEDILIQNYPKDMMDPMQPLGPSAYRNWKAKHKPPWTIGYASSYAGNTWRAGVMNRLENVIIPKWTKLGLLKEVIITQSNLKDSVQIQQMRQLVDRGVDALIVCCGNPTALNQTIKYAYDRGVPTFSFVGYVTSPYAVSSSANFVVGGYKLGKWMAKELNGKGNVLIVEGIPGTSASDSQDRGIKLALKEYPDIKIVGEVAGMWTDQVAQAEIQKWLATHPGKLDGIIIQCASELGAIRALKQSGRPMIPITVGGESGALCYWRQHPDYVSGAYHAWPPGDGFELSWNIMMRTLQGQGPKIQSILASPVYWDLNDLKKNVAEDCSEDSDQFTNVGIEKWANKEFLDNFFLRPADPEKYKP